MTADNRPLFRVCICGGTMVRQGDTTATEAGYKCVSCGHFQPDALVSWFPRRTPLVQDKVKK